MIRTICVAAVLAVPGIASAQPRIIEMQPPPVSLRSLEESVELLEAALDVKRAYVKAAEVAVSAAKSWYNLTSAGNPARADIEKAKHELEAAEALLGIRQAEQREVEVRLKQVKRRLGEAKPAAPKIRPMDPPKPVGSAPALGEELKLLVQSQEIQVRIQKLKAAHDLAQAEAARMSKLVAAGLVPEKVFLQAQQAATIAELDLLLARAELQVLEVKRRSRSDEDSIPAPRPK